ncbi:hypothetical protein Rhe02_37880 [Rhizocola hellebori]|uniref:Uncharacterized protein n=1 Tax=Rhizocola hellebori TaxID=1392758 RepID=A0A8J3Q9R9_9ACTN|nr:hypothetical protein [Rhizocola hellebori]GIH05721.1 hypothetical protein Rhe02_37880 [Rhizocola hellebori]
MADTVSPPTRQRPTRVVLISAAVSGLVSLITITLLGGIIGGQGIFALPVQSPAQPASASQVEAVAEVTLPPGTVLLSGAYSNGLETMLSAKFRLPRTELDTFLASAKFAGELTEGLRTITAAHNVGGGNLWDPETAQAVSGLRERQPTGRGTWRTMMLNLDTTSAVTVYLHAHRG